MSLNVAFKSGIVHWTECVVPLGPSVNVLTYETVCSIFSGAGKVTRDAKMMLVVYKRHLRAVPKYSGLRSALAVIQRKL